MTTEEQFTASPPVPRTLLLQNKVDFVKVEEIAESNMNAVLFDKFLYRGQTLLIKSEKGTGSTWVCIEIARAVLSGSRLFSNYTYCRPSNTETKQDLVILFEGSTPVEVLYERIKLMKIDTAKDNFHLFSKQYEDKQDTKSLIKLNLTDKKWIDQFESMITSFKETHHIILIFDSIDSLIFKDKDNKKDDFDTWLKTIHKNSDITQIWIDKGVNTGFKIPYEYIDLSIELKAKKGRGNVAMQVEFCKANLLKKEDTMPFVIELQDCIGEPYKVFKHTSSEIDKENMAVVMMIEGLVQTEIAKRLSVSQPMVSIWKANAIHKGLIRSRGNNNIATEEGEKLVKYMRVNI